MILFIFQKVGSMVNVVDLFHSQMKDFAGHKFRMSHQYTQIRFVRENCGPQDLLLHIDFSENYSEKYATEVQASHFGSRHQIVLHQGIAYLKVNI
jgi:hypothetical protein